MWGIELNRESDVPIKRQIYEAFKQRMMNGSLEEGDAMPSTRELASALSVSRSTACEAYDMLLAEGFIIAHQGAPTRVAPGLVVDGSPEQRSMRRTLKRGSPICARFRVFRLSRALKKPRQSCRLRLLVIRGRKGRCRCGKRSRHTLIEAAALKRIPRIYSSPRARLTRCT